MDFYDLDLDDATLDALDAMRFEKCSPIQEAAIPVILEGKDVIGVAQTGTGKTAAYLLPILNQLNKGTYSEDHVNCVIMAPTRELAQQIDKAMEGFSYFMNVSSVAIYGGNDGIRYEQEKRGLTKGADIVIATPGRLISHMSLGNVDLQAAIKTKTSCGASPIRQAGYPSVLLPLRGCCWRFCRCTFVFSENKHKKRPLILHMTV